MERVLLGRREKGQEGTWGEGTGEGGRRGRGSIVPISLLALSCHYLHCKLSLHATLLKSVSFLSRSLENRIDVMLSIVLPRIITHLFTKIRFQLQRKTPLGE